MPLPIPPLPLADVHSRLVRHVPQLLAKWAPAIPFFIQRNCLESGLNYILEENIRDGDFDFLTDHHITVKIADIGLSWTFSFKDNRLHASQMTHADACIKGNLNEFMLLIAREEDPDTLFFQRRLVIEGDTEISLEMKNVLDNIELDNLPSSAHWLLKKLTQLLTTTN